MALCQNLVSSFNELRTAGAAVGAIITGTLAITAYLLKTLLEAIFDWNRKERRRMEILTSLREEIANSASNLRKRYTPDFRKSMEFHFTKAKIKQIPYIPFIPSLPADVMFQLVKTEIVSLGGGAIDEIAQYYYADALINVFLAKIGSKEFINLSIDRQEASVLQVFDWYAPQLTTAADKAVIAIEKAQTSTFTRRRRNRAMAKSATSSDANEEAVPSKVDGAS